MAEPRERPMIFSAPKVQYILGLPVGAIFQTRLVVKPQLPALVADLDQILDTEWWKPCWSLPPFEGDGTLAGIGTPAHQAALAEMDRQLEEDGNICRRSPCGVPGDRVWGRETWAPMCRAADPYCWCDTEEEREKYHYVEYRADTGNPYPGEWPEEDETPGDCVPRWRSSSCMPRRASRILAEVVQVDIARLQEVSEEDALADGFSSAEWASNLWVWAYTLRKLEAPHARAKRLSATAFMDALAALSHDSFARIWDNPLDAEYDRL